MFVNNYLKNGYSITNPTLDEREVLLLRKELKDEFINYDKNIIKDLHQFKNLSLAEKIINIFNNPVIQNEVKEFEIKYETKAALLPLFCVHKNYHVNLREKTGWHRDCAGELHYDYSRNIVYSKKYLFSMVGVYLQENRDFGGSIDIIKYSHKNFSKSQFLIRKLKSVPLKLVMLFNKYFNKLYNLIPEKFFMFFLRAKKLYPKPSSAVFFDSRIVHRGSPIFKKNLNLISYKKNDYQAFMDEKLSKYSIYCHFGTVDSVDSYFFERLKRKNNANELKMWIKQTEFISKFDKKVSEQINLILDPIKKKYSNFI